MTDLSDPQVQALIKQARSATSAASIYGPNEEGERAAWILPDVGARRPFTADPDGVNINGFKGARLIYQVRVPSDAPAWGNSRVGALLSTVWEDQTVTPTAKASHYSVYITASGNVGNADFPQEVGAIVAKAETAAGQEHGKTETSIFVAEHELKLEDDGAGFGFLTEDGDDLDLETGDALTTEDAAALPVNGKLVVQQQVLVFRGPDIGWNADPDADENDDDADAGSLDPEGSVADPQDSYFGYGTAFNNGGPTPGYAAAIVKARAAARGGSPWHHGFYVKKNAVDAYSFRHKNQVGIQASGFDPGDGAHAMPYFGLGTDLPAAPVHVKGAMALEQRFESTQSGASAYTLNSLTFYGRSDFGTATIEMAGQAVSVTDPSHNIEDAEIAWSTRQHGDLADRLRLGGGLYSPNATGGDKGPDTINVKAVCIDGFIELGDDPLAASPVTPTGVTQTKQGMVVKAVAPVDTRLRSVNVYRHAATDDAAAAFAAGAIDNYSVRSGKKIKWVDTDALTSGTDYYYYFATVTKKEVEGVLTLIGHATYKGVQAADIESGAVSWGTHLTGVPAELNDGRIPAALAASGALVQAAGVELSSGFTAPVGLLPQAYSVTDGDVVTFPVDLGDTPYAIITGQEVLPTPAAGDSYSLRLDPLTSTGFTAVFKKITPGAKVSKSAAGDPVSQVVTGMPLLTGTGFSVTKADAADPCNGRFKLKLRLQWSSTILAGFTESYRVYYKDGGGWVKLVDIDWTVPVNGAQTNYAATWILPAPAVSLSATAQIAFQYKSATPHVLAATNHPIDQLQWVSRTDTVLSAVTDELLVLVFPQNTA